MDDYRVIEVFIRPQLNKGCTVYSIRLIAMANPWTNKSLELTICHVSPKRHKIFATLLYQVCHNLNLVLIMYIHV